MLEKTHKMAQPVHHSALPNGVQHVEPKRIPAIFLKEKGVLRGCSEISGKPLCCADLSKATLIIELWHVEKNVRRSVLFETPVKKSRD